MILSQHIATATHSRAGKIAVIVVHGVGEAEPGEAVATLAAGFRRFGAKPIRHEEVLRLRENPADGQSAAGKAPPDASSGTDATFPVFMRHASLGDGRELTLAELYWADLTRLGSGSVSSMLGLFRVIFEAHYVIDAMLDRPGDRLVRMLRGILLWLSWLMRGPIAGMSICTLTLFWAGLYARPTGIIGNWSGPHLFGAHILLLALISLGLLLWSRRKDDVTWQTSLTWTLIGCVGIGCWLAAVEFSHRGFALDAWLQLPNPQHAKPWTVRHEYINPVYKALMLLWVAFTALWTAAIAVLFVVGVHGRLSKMRSDRFAAAHASTGILTLQLALWTGLVGTAVLPLLNRAQEVIAVTEVAPVLAQSTSKSKLEQEDVRRMLDVPDFPAVQYDWVPRFIFAYGFNGFIIIGLIVYGGLLFAVRTMLAARVRDRDEAVLAATARIMPRLLFSRWLIGSLIAITFVQLFLHIVFSQRTLQGDFNILLASVLSALLPAAHAEIQGFKDNLDTYFKHYLNITMIFAWVMAVLLPMAAGKGFNNAVHVARDLIDHQFGPWCGRLRGGGAGARLTDEKRYPRRARIQKRLATLIDALPDRSSYTQILFVAHSQGSIVVYDYLKANAAALAADAAVKPGVVTFGSPLGHIYQRYFCGYAEVVGELDKLQPGLTRWINLYRIDDYIGTWIGPHGEGPVENRALPPGGHVDYWKEDVVAQTILEMVLADDAARRDAPTMR